MRCEEIRQLLPLHALGALQEGDAAQVREHLEAGCPGCAAELAALGETLSAIPFVLERAEPSPMAKARLMAAVRGTPPPIRESLHRRASWERIALAAAVAAVLVLLFGVMVVNRRHAAEAEELRAQIREQKEELARLGEQFRRTRETILLVRSPGSKVIDLLGQGSEGASAARVFWDVRKSTWRLYADNLPPAGAGRAYQLWLITAQAKISAGVFHPDEDASGTVTVPTEAGPVVAAAVTPEPEGGSPQPTGAIVLLGKI